MLDEKRAEDLSKTGALGIGKVLEQQMRASVLGTPAAAPSADAPKEREQ
jgi:Rod binding domain-containing protein